jgi:3-hydroxyisobutyrate dehydrogenase
MAQRLLGAGFSVRVYNRSASRRDELVEQGALGFETPKDAAAEADVVLSMVRDDDASAQVWLHPETGALAGMRADAVALECSTLSPAGTAKLGAAAAEAGIALVDAPVVGTRPQAEGGALVFLVGGEASPVATVKPLFDAMGSAVHHVGPLGRGTAMKLAVNALFGIQVAALAELLAALGRAGIAPAQAMDVLGSLAVCSPAAKGTGGLMVAERYAPLFPVELVEKDFGYAVGLAEQAGVPAPVSTAARAVFAQAKREGLGGENLVAVAKLYR